LAAAGARGTFDRDVVVLAGAEFSLSSNEAWQSL
jgi:hypothetical protein